MLPDPHRPMNPAVDSYLLDAASGRPATLYHYTSTAALLGIVESRKLWASSAFQLNDLQEILRTRNLLDRVCAELAGVEPDEKVKQGLLTLRSPEHMLQFARNVPCVAALSTERDQLSQWRAYARGPAGVCIGFNISAIPESDERFGHFFVARCEYDEKRQRDALKDSIRASVEYLRSVGAPLDAGTLAQTMLSDLAVLAPIFKDPAFQEEREWRIITGPQPDHPDLRFRTTAAGVVPYREFDLSVGDSLPITEIILAPGPHVDRAMHGMVAFVQSKKLKVRISNSSIPYRQDLNR